MKGNLHFELARLATVTVKAVETLKKRIWTRQETRCKAPICWQSYTTFTVKLKFEVHYYLLEIFFPFFSVRTLTTSLASSFLQDSQKMLHFLKWNKLILNYETCQLTRKIGLLLLMYPFTLRGRLFDFENVSFLTLTVFEK